MRSEMKCVNRKSIPASTCPDIIRRPPFSNGIHIIVVTWLDTSRDTGVSLDTVLYNSTCF